MSGSSQSAPIRSADKSMRVLLTILLAITLTGFFVGMRQSRQASEKEAVYGKESVPAEGNEEFPVVVSYSERPSRKLGPNREWTNSLTSLRQPSMPVPPKDAPTRDTIQQLLAQRESGRAFDGAPPVIPHPTPPLGQSACLACHGEGLMIGDKRASKISHPPYGNCGQCHVEVINPDSKPFWENTFAALRPKPADRAFPGAPPAMPHPVWMRTECQSCHGVTGPAPLRTTHPERVNCLQCHALTDAMDRMPLASASPEPKDKR